MTGSLAGKIAVLSVGAALAMTLTLTIVDAGQVDAFATSATNETAAENTAQLKGLSLEMSRLVELQHAGLRNRLDVALPLTLHYLEEAGEFSQGSTTATWATIDRGSGRASSVSLPRMKLGANWLGQVADPAQDLPVIDDAAAKTGTQIVVYQLLPDSSGLVAVAASAQVASARSRSTGAHGRTPASRRRAGRSHT